MKAVLSFTFRRQLPFLAFLTFKKPLKKPILSDFKLVATPLTPSRYTV